MTHVTLRILVNKEKTTKKDMKKNKNNKVKWDKNKFYRILTKRVNEMKSNKYMTKN